MKPALRSLVTKLCLPAFIVFLQFSTVQAQTFNFRTWNKDSNAVLTVNAFRSVTIDKRGIVWVGSDLGGLYNYKDTTWKKINTYPDVTFRHLVPSNVSLDSNVWATSIGKNGIQATTGGAYLIDTKAEMVTQYGSGIAGGLSSRFANSLAMSSRGVTYVALAQSTIGTTVNQGGVYKIFTLNPPLPSTNSFVKAIPDANDITYHSAGNRGDELWFGRGANCKSGCIAPYIARLSSSGEPMPPITAANSPLPFTNAPTSSFARAIYTDTISGNTFVGLSSGGVGVYKQDGTWKLLNDSNSAFPAGGAVNFNAIADVYGEIWIGTTFGIFVYNGTGSLDDTASFKLLTVTNGLPAPNITDIAVDTARSQIWITSLVGVSRAPYIPPFIKGVLYDVSCNRPESTLDSLRLFDVFQKKPLVGNVTVELYENGTLRETATVDSNGVFELKKAEDGKSYLVQVKYKNDGKEIIYKYPNIKNHQLMGAILMPVTLIEEVKAFKSQMKRRCFELELPFLLKVSAACRDGFFVSEYDQAYAAFYDANGIQANHKKYVENLGDFYTAAATVYSLGGISTSLMNKSVACGFDAVESLFAFAKFGKAVKEKQIGLDGLDDDVETAVSLLANIASVMKEGVVSILKFSVSSASDPATKKILENIITCINDLADLTIAIADKGEKASPKIGLDLLKKYAALQVSASVYKDYCQVKHKDFVKLASLSSKTAYSPYEYDRAYNQLYNPVSNSVQKTADDIYKFRDTVIQNYQVTAKAAGYASEILDGATALSLIPGGQLAGLIAKGLATTAKLVKTGALVKGMVEGAEGYSEVADLSGYILADAGFKQSRPLGFSYSRVKRPPSQLSPELLLIRKNAFNQKLTELQAIYNSPLYDSVTFYSKYTAFAKEDSLYTKEMSKTLNALWASADSACILVPGFTTKLEKVITSFVSQQYTLRNSFFFQNLGYIFDSDKTAYVSELNSMADELKILNDSAVNGLGYLVDDINLNGIAAPAYLAQEAYSLDFNYLPGSNGTMKYIFKNYGTEPQLNVSFKIDAPTAGYVYTTADSINVGTVLPGESKEVSFSFKAPLTDSICRYTIDVHADNGQFLDVTGSLFVNDPAKFYSAKDGNWSDPSTWSSNTVPTASSNVVVSHAVKIDIDATCKSINAVIPGTVTINAGKRLDVLK